jgi:hypothetical protein
MIWLLVGVIIGTLAPFTLVSNWNQIAGKLSTSFEFTIASFKPGEILERALFFSPLGFLMGYRTTGRMRRACLSLSIVLVGLEVAQVFVRGRHARVSDMLVAAIVGGLGVWLGTRVGRGGLGNLRKHSVSVQRSALRTAHLACLALPCAAHFGTALQYWDYDYPLVIGNEATSDRPWTGQLARLAVFDRAIDPDEVSHHVGDPMAEARGVLAFADFASGHQWLRNEAAFELVSPDGAQPERTDEGLQFQGAQQLGTADGARAISHVLIYSGAFSILLDAHFSDLTLTGPARLVSVSESTGRRNVTLSQHLGGLDYRVRTDRMGPNGSRVSCRTATDRLTVGWHRVLATFDDGIMDLRIDGKRARSPLVMYHVGVRVFGRGFLGAGLGAAIVLILPLAGLSVICWPGRSFVKQSLIAAGPTVAVSLISTALTGRIVDSEYIIAAIAMGFCGALLGAAYLRWGTSQHAPGRFDCNNGV